MTGAGAFFLSVTVFLVFLLLVYAGLFVLVRCFHVGSWSCEDCLHMIVAVGKRNNRQNRRASLQSITRVTAEKDPPVTNKREGMSRRKYKKKGRCNTTLRWQSIKIEKPVGCLYSSTRNRPKIGIEYFPFLLFLIFLLFLPQHFSPPFFSCFNLGRFGVQSFGRSSAVSKVRVHREFELRLG